jgi:hypothetical protein
VYFDPVSGERIELRYQPLHRFGPAGEIAAEIGAQKK